MLNKETVVRQVNGKSVNQEVVFGVGRLTNDPPQIVTVGDNGAKVMRGSKDHNFAIAFNVGKDKTEFLNITLWNKNAENLEKLGFKGQRIAVVGRIEKSEYNGKSYENLVVERFQVIDYKNNEDNKEDQSELEGASENYEDDEIPF